MITYLNDLAQPAGPALDHATREEAEAGLRAFLLDPRARVKHDDGAVEEHEARGFAITWKCCEKSVGITFLLVTPGSDRYRVGAGDSPGLTVADDEIRFRCRTCGRSRVLRGSRALALLLDLARAYPETGRRRVTREIRFLR